MRINQQKNQNMELFTKEKNVVEDCTKFDLRTKVIFVLILVLIFINHIRFDNTVLRNVPMEPFSEPIQEKIENGESFMEKTPVGKVMITPIADYKLYGRVYDKHYRPSKLYLASVYPYDVSIGFGGFKEKEVYKAVKVKMAATVSYWSCSGSDWRNHVSKYFKSQSIDHCFTNNHLRPANKNVKRGIKKLRKKDIVYIEGYLVKIVHTVDNGRIEKGISSTSRNDKETFSGDNSYGACEQIYVTRVVSRHGDFR